MQEGLTAPESIRCPDCGGLNRAGSAWCGQCLRRLDVSDEGTPAGSSEKEGSTPPRTAEAAPGQAKSPARGAFRVEGGIVFWTCPRCETENSLTQDACTVCGAAFVEMVRPPDPPRKEVDPGTAALLSLFWPGAGHGYLGRWGEAVARGALTAWTVLVVLLTAMQAGAGTARATIGVFGVASVGLWLAGAHDAYRAARGEDALVILKGRRYLYLVLGLLLVLITLLTMTGLSAQAG